MQLVTSFTNALNSNTQEGLLRAIQMGYQGALLGLLIPSVIFGVGMQLAKPTPIPTAAIWGLGLVMLALSGATFYWANKAALNPQLLPKQAALTAAIQAATVPALPFIFACSLCSQGLALALFLPMAAVFYRLVWQQLPKWIRADTFADATPNVKSSAIPPIA